MRALVIGGTGFIGLNIVKALQAEGVPVVCTRRPSSNTLFLRALKPELVTADCGDPASLRAAMKGIQAVFMAAGHYPRYSVGLAGQVRKAREEIRNVLEAAREAGVSRFIYTSSTATEGRPVRGSVYFAVKRAMEAEVLAALRGGLPGTILCPSACFGPYDVKVGTGGVFVGALTGRLPFYVDGRFNLIDVEDVARAHVAALRAPALKERYLLAHHNTSVSEFLARVAGRYGGVVPRRLPLPIGYPWAFVMERYHHRRRSRSPLPLELVEMLVHGRHFDDRAARTDLYPYDTPLEATLDKAYAWFKRYRYIH